MTKALEGFRSVQTPVVQPSSDDRRGSKELKCFPIYNSYLASNLNKRSSFRCCVLSKAELRAAPKRMTDGEGRHLPPPLSGPLPFPVRPLSHSISRTSHLPPAPTRQFCSFLSTVVFLPLPLPAASPTSPDKKAKRHEVKSDPTPLGLRGSAAAPTPARRAGWLCRHLGRKRVDQKSQEQ